MNEIPSDSGLRGEPPSDPAPPSFPAADSVLISSGMASGNFDGDDSGKRAFPDEAMQAQIRQCLNSGRLMDAWGKIRHLAPPDQWLEAGPEAACLGSRLVSWLGNPGRAAAMDRVALRRYPDHPEVFLLTLGVASRAGGALSMLKRIQDRDHHPVLTDRQRAFLLNVEADLWSRWSDFTRAHRCLDEAEKLRPGHDREVTSRAKVLMREDQREAALELTEEALRRQPGGCTTHWLKAHLLRELGRDEESREALESATTVVQDEDIVLALANWHADRGHHAQALRLSEEYAAMQPLMSRSLKRWLAAWRARQHYLNGDREAALSCAAEAPKCFISEIADRLRAGIPGVRKRLEVPFVRQNHRTCGPATLTAICRFHGDASEQVDIAQDICYDGTPDHTERHWAEEKGWMVREFRVTPDTARALIDAGLPFTLTTVEPASAHLQAVIGYDTESDTLLIMEPGSSAHAEYRMKVLETYAFSGPRGMVLAPRTPALEAALAAIDLPEAELYDALHRFQRALHGHRREDALRELEELRRTAPDHRLRWVAERCLATSDGNPVRQLVAVEEMLKLYPEQPTLLYEKLWLLASVAGRREQREFALKVKAAGKAPAEVDRLLAELLDDDARDWPQAERAWIRALRGRPFQVEVLSGMAGFLWTKMERGESLLLYRLAACVNPKSEGPSRSYFVAARWVGSAEREESLQFLRERVERYGGQSSDPAGTLAWALGQIREDAGALKVLEEAALRRPDDGEALLAAGDAFLSAGEVEKARHFFTMAEHRVPQGLWLRHLAEESVKAADLAAAVTHYRQLAELEPANRGVHSELARLLAGTGGAAAAVAWLEEACRKLPGTLGLHSLLCDWLEGNYERRGEVLRHMRSVDPSDSWTARELALDLKATGKLDEALTAAREALAMDPKNHTSAGILAMVLTAAGRREEASEWLRRSLELNVDYPWAITELMDLAPDTVTRRRELQWVFGQMEAQILEGSSLEGWAREAWVLLEPEETLAAVETVKAARPDLWQSWTVCGNHLRDMGRMDDALSVVEEGVRRFPLLPRMWHELSLIHSARGEAALEKTALEQALKMSPGWSTAARRLAELLRDMDQPMEARALLEGFTRSWPMDQGALADLIRLLRTMGDTDAAAAASRRAVALFPLAEEIWRQAASLQSGETERLELSLEVRELTTRLPLSLSAWQCRAAVEAVRGGFNAELEILDEALAKMPGCWDFLDRKSLLLSECGRYEEALACCRMDSPDASAAQHWREARAADILFRQGMEEEAVEALTRVAETHPDYSWSAQKLLEWHDHRAEWEQVLKWSGRLTRLNPRQQMPWGYRGGALLALGRGEEAEAALRQAVALDAGYAWAARQLLELELKRGDSQAAAATVARVRGRVPISGLAALFTKHGFADEALELCGEAVRLNSTDADGHETLGHALWKAGRKDEALKAWQQAVQLAPSRGWETALSEKAAEAGQWEAVLESLRTWALEKTPPSADALKAWASFATRKTERRLAALDEAFRLMPAELEFMDLKALTLAEAARAGEAEHVCRFSGAAGEIPPMLRRRLAWLLERRGDRKQAIREMETALKAEENNQFALRNICDWLVAEQRAEEAVKWAGVLVETAPQSAISFGYLAHTLLKSGEEAKAEPHLRRALRMWPEYDFAGDILFSLRLKRQDHEAARRTLAILREHQPGVRTILKEVELEVACVRKNEAVLAVERLEADPACTRQLLDSADKFLEKQGWLEEVRKQRLRFATGTELPSVGKDWKGPALPVVESWIQHEISLRHYRVWKKFASLAGGETTQMTAWCVWLELFGDLGRKDSWEVRLGRSLELMWVIRKNAFLLRRETRTWAWALYALTTYKRYRAARRLARGWEERPELKPWILHNIAESFDQGGYRGEAAKARAWALERVQPDQTIIRHQLQHAFTLASEGKAFEALQLLKDANMADVPAGSTGVRLRLHGVFAKVLALLSSTDRPAAERRRQAEQELVRGLKENGGLRGHAAPWRLTARFLSKAVRLAGADLRLQLRLFCLWPRLLGVNG